MFYAFIIGIVAIVAIFVFATQPVGQAIYSYSGNNSTCGYYCASSNTAKCTGATKYGVTCSNVGCVTSCWGKYRGPYPAGTGCDAAHDDVCVGATGKTTDAITPNKTTPINPAGTCGYYCTSSSSTICAGSTKITELCTWVGCKTTCLGAKSSSGVYTAGCSDANSRVCVGSTNSPSDKTTNTTSNQTTNTTTNKTTNTTTNQTTLKCGDYCVSSVASKCTGSKRAATDCRMVGCKTSCWGQYLGSYSGTGCDSAHDDVCVGATGKLTDAASPPYCSAFCASNSTTKCSGADYKNVNCASLGCKTSCWGFYQGSYTGTNCTSAKDDVCVGATGKLTERPV